MSHSQDPHKSFVRYASVLRENLTACDASLRKGEEDWQATLGRLNAAFNQVKNLNDVIESSYEHMVYIPKKCTANIQDVSNFLSCRCTPESGIVQEKNGKSTATGAANDNVCVEEINIKKEELATATLLHRYEQKVSELASEFEEGIVRF